MNISERKLREAQEIFASSSYLTFATTSTTENERKVDEMNSILKENVSLPISIRLPDEKEIILLERLYEVQEIDVLTVARFKAREAHKLFERPVIVEDVSLGLTEKNNFPGALIKWVRNSLGNEGICRIADSTQTRMAIASSVFSIALYSDDPEMVFSFKGDSLGWIADHERGNQGFGFDNIYIPGEQRYTFGRTLMELFNRGMIDIDLITKSMPTYAQMPPEGKNVISMRRMALTGLTDFLRLVSTAN